MHDKLDLIVWKPVVESLDNVSGGRFSTYLNANGTPSDSWVYPDGSVHILDAFEGGAHIPVMISDIVSTALDNHMETHPELWLSGQVDEYTAAIEIWQNTIWRSLSAFTPCHYKLLIPMAYFNATRELGLVVAPLTISEQLDTELLPEVAMKLEFVKQPTKLQQERFLSVLDIEGFGFSCHNLPSMVKHECDIRIQIVRQTRKSLTFILTGANISQAVLNWFVLRALSAGIDAGLSVIKIAMGGHK